MIYFVGGAPRVGKSIVCQQVAARLAIGWMSTDVLVQLLKLQSSDVVSIEWNVLESISATAEWFFPYLERFVWGVGSLAEQYVIEGVDFLPAHVARLAEHYPLRCVFLGCSDMTLERFERFPGKSPGYTGLPPAIGRQIVAHVPMHSELVRREAERFGFPYLDMAGDFAARLRDADAALTGR